MKKLTIILTLLLSFGFSQIMMPDTSKMTNTEKMIWYQAEKKSPTLAVFLNFVFQTSGYAYAGDWKRGLKIKGAQLLIFGTGMICLSAPNEAYYRDGEQNLASYAGLVMVFGTIPLVVWEYIDVAKTTKKYNNQLYKNLFGKDGSMQFSLIPQPKGIGLGLSYNF